MTATNMCYNFVGFRYSPAIKNTKMGDPMCDQCSGTRVIREENCFWPSGKTVHHGREINVSAGR